MTNLIQSRKGDTADLQVVVLDDKLGSTGDGEFDGLRRKNVPQTGDHLGRVRKRFLSFVVVQGIETNENKEKSDVNTLVKVST